MTVNTTAFARDKETHSATGKLRHFSDRRNQRSTEGAAVGIVFPLPNGIDTH
jgi:hypothetical protein